MVLVSLLVDRLSSLFLSFFGWPKKICSVSGNFWSGSDFFGWPNFYLVHQNFFLLYQKIRAWPKKIQRLTKNSLRPNKFFLVDQKKWEIDRTIGRPRDWPKPHGRDWKFVLCLNNCQWKLGTQNSGMLEDTRLTWTHTPFFWCIGWMREFTLRSKDWMHCLIINPTPVPNQIFYSAQFDALIVNCPESVGITV